MLFRSSLGLTPLSKISRSVVEMQESLKMKLRMNLALELTLAKDSFQLHLRLSSNALVMDTFPLVMKFKKPFTNLRDLGGSTPEEAGSVGHSRGTYVVASPTTISLTVQTAL